MKELSLHILDIVQNSIAAGAGLIEIEVVEKTQENLMIISIKDNGCGMSEELLKAVIDPFTTSRTTRSVGLGISLFKLAAEQCEGRLSIESKLNVGTKLIASFRHSHIDRQPLGSISQTIAQLVLCNSMVEFVYRHKTDNSEFEFDTAEVKKVLDGVEITNTEVISWIEGYIREQILEIGGEC